MIVNPPFDITGSVRPAALPREDLEITEGNLIVSGTGNTETGKSRTQGGARPNNFSSHHGSEN